MLGEKSKEVDTLHLKLYVDFLKKVYFQDSGYIEVIYNDKWDAKHIKPYSLNVETLLFLYNGDPLKIGYALRKEPYTKKTGKSNVFGSRILFFDIDWHEPQFKPDQKIPIEEFKNRLNKIGLIPTMIIDSGRGYHLLYVVDSFLEPEKHEKYQKRMIEILENEFGAVVDNSLTDISKVMRIPCFPRNDGYPLPQIVYFEKRTTSLKEIDKKYKEIHEKEKRSDPQIGKALFEKIIKALNEKKYPYKRYGKYIMIKCPFCDVEDKHPSFEIRLKDSGYIRCKDYHTNTEYSLKDVLQKIGIDDILQYFSESVSDEDPFIIRARHLYQHAPYFYDAQTKFFWVWDVKRKVYVKQEDDEVIVKYYKQLDDSLSAEITKQSKKNRIIQAMKIVGLQNRPKDPKRTWIKFKDVVVDIETMETFEATPDFFFTHTIPHKLSEEDYDTPNIDALFRKWVGEENKQLLYEIMAYCLLPDYPIHRMFILYGSGRNGKGSFMRLLTRFIGFDNVVSTEIERIEQSRFETARFYHKLVALIGETNFTTLKNTAILKSLTGQDVITAEFKHKGAFEFINYAKIIMATNTLPLTSDTTDGFFSRMIIIDFPNVFNEGKDVIDEIPEEEFEKLARKSILILKDLLKKGRFHNEGTIEEKRERYKRRSIPIYDFIDERCIFDPEGYVSTTEFYNKFRAWMFKRKARFRIPSFKEVMTLLEAEYGLDTGVRKYYEVDGEKIRLRSITGIRWKENLTDYDASHNIESSHTSVSSASCEADGDTTNKWCGTDGTKGTGIYFSRFPGGVGEIKKINIPVPSVPSVPLDQQEPLDTPSCDPKEVKENLKEEQEKFDDILWEEEILNHPKPQLKENPYLKNLSKEQIIEDGAKALCNWFKDEESFTLIDVEFAMPSDVLELVSVNEIIDFAIKNMYIFEIRPGEYKVI